MNLNPQDFTHKIVKKEKKQQKTNEFTRDSIAFTYNGFGSPSIVPDSSDEAFAKSVSVGGNDVYYVKMYKIGRDIGKLPNPKSLDFQKGKKNEKIGGIEVIQWQAVKKEIFDDYLNFLNTGESKWLRSAQSRIQS
jgi:hypothetical protein